MSKITDKKTIGVFVCNSSAFHANDFIQGVKLAGDANKVNIMYFLGNNVGLSYVKGMKICAGEKHQISTVYDYAKYSNLDALIVPYGELKSYLPECEKEGFLDKFKDIKKVFVNEDAIDETSSYVSIDNYASERKIIEHLVIDHGYRKVCFLAGPKGNFDAEERLRAYLDVMSEQGIDVDDNMIGNGNFTSYVTDVVERLIDNNPGLEAIACANDDMAQAVYDVCKARELEILNHTDFGEEMIKAGPCRYIIGKKIKSGEGIAVTGCDNNVMASLNNPPLTTVIQNNHTIGYRAVETAIKLIEGKRQVVSVEAEILKKGSCGCNESGASYYPRLTGENAVTLVKYAADISNIILDKILVTDADDEVVAKLGEEIYSYAYINASKFLTGKDEEEIVDNIATQINCILNGDYRDYIDIPMFQDFFERYFSFAINNLPDNKSQICYLDVFAKGLIEFKNYTVKDNILDNRNTMVNIWYMSYMAREFSNYQGSESEIIRNTLSKLTVFDIGDTYIYFFNEPIVHRAGDVWKTPKKLYLMGYVKDGNNIDVYRSKEECPFVTVEDGILSVFDTDKETVNMTVINLFSDDVQYGIMVSNVKPGLVKMLNFITVQLGTALKYCNIIKSHVKIQKELEEKNQILGFVSVSDELTKCLNRRGFMEHAMVLNGSSKGLKAAVIFADLDHLKEINDVFGHNAGDFAIISIADIIRDAIDEDAVIGRIGGDEFVILVMEEDMTATDAVASIKQAMHRFNENSGKDFYVEASLGYEEFICGPEINIQDVVSLADEALYEEKEKRRKSIIK